MGSGVANGGRSTAGLGGSWDWTGIVGSGQSLSVGVEGEIRSTRQRYGNLKLSLGPAAVPPFDPASRALSMVALVEPIRPLTTMYPSAYPANICGETPHTVMASQISSMVMQSFGQDYVTVHTVVGESGQPMAVLRKGAAMSSAGRTSMGRAYAATLFEARAIALQARAAGKTYGVGAIILTHGESDADNPGYQADLEKLWSDYNTDLRAITGQTRAIPMLVSQQNSVNFAHGVRTGASASTLAEWRVGVDHAGDVICSGPKYQYLYSVDGVHLVARGYELLGEKYGEVYFNKVVLGRDWQPLSPTFATRSGAVLTVHFHVPTPPLAWDYALGPPHKTALTEWCRGRGFEVQSGDAPLTITSVVISGDAVEITCSTHVPEGALVGYALTSDGTRRPGGTARWGQLRDSCATLGASTGLAQPNYCVAFQLRVP